MLSGASTKQGPGCFDKLVACRNNDAERDGPRLRRGEGEGAVSAWVDPQGFSEAGR